VVVVTAPSAPRSLTAVHARIAPSTVKKEWQRVESWRSRRRRLKAAAPPRCRVPADLTRVCFNCFSPSHVATCCHQKTRCFRCQDLGHRSVRCLGKRSGGFREQPKRVGSKFGLSKPRTLVWWRKTVPAAMVAPSAPPPSPPVVEGGEAAQAVSFNTSAPGAISTPDSGGESWQRSGHPSPASTLSFQAAAGD
jgi:hypothetical protein